MRCLSLAFFLKSHGFLVTFITSQESVETVPSLRNSGFEIRNRPRNLSVDWLIIDNYELNEDYEISCASWARNILVFDDLMEHQHACDIILNQTFGVNPQDYEGLLQPKTKLLLGSRYAILHDKFRNESVKDNIRNLSNPKKVFICFGGVNPHNATQWVLDTLEHYTAQKLRLIVCASGIPENIQNIQQAITKCSIHDIEFHEHATNIPELMRHSDIAIGAGGSMSWERCCMGLPTLTIEVADNQKTVLQLLHEAGAIHNLGQFHALSKAKFVSSFTTFIEDTRALEDISTTAYNICDGRGVFRILPHLIKPEYSKNKETVTLCEATKEDCDNLFEWQTELGAREYARNPEPPQYEEHCQWLSATLSNPEKELYIVKTNDIACGMVRLDKMNERHKDGFEVSILISQNHQGKGLALSALNLLRKLKPNAVLWAHIFQKNEKSINLFKKAKYITHSDTWYLQKP